jgi:hypothetical protein
MASLHAMDRNQTAVTERGTERFSGLFLQSIEDAATNVLGETAARTVLARVVPTGADFNPKELSSHFHMLFGLGADIIERCVVRELFGKLGMPKIDENHFDFVREVNRAMMVSEVAL